MTVNNFPSITPQQMAEVDRLAVENGLLVMQMMEYAGLNIARFVESKSPNSVLILCGKGHNGGDGIAAARHLVNWGIEVKIILAEEPIKLKETSKHHYELLKKMSVTQEVWEDSDSQRKYFQEADLIIDALLGYNISGDPRMPYKIIIESANNSGKPIIAVDLPSGLNGENGEPYNPCIKANDTLTLALPKTGLNAQSKKFTGNVFVCDLGIPEFIYKNSNIDIPEDLFADAAIKPIEL